MGALLLRGGRLLLAEHTRDQVSYWVFPGGEAVWGESLEQALVREVREETGILVSAKRLLYVGQNIRPASHSIEFFFLASPVSGRLRRERGGILTGLGYFRFEDLGALDLRPPISQVVLSSYGCGFHHPLLYLGDLALGGNRKCGIEGPTPSSWPA